MPTWRRETIDVRRLLVGGVIALAVLLVGAVAASADVSERDTASTKAYIALRERYDTATIEKASATNAAGEAVVAEVRSECPRVLKAVPKKANAHQIEPIVHFFTEAALVLDAAQMAPLHGISDRVGEQQRRLRFSDPALQWEVNVDGSALSAYVDLIPPDLCAGARVLAASHFTKMTEAGTRFLKDASTLLPLEAAPPTSLVRKMRPYAPDAVSGALKRLPELHRTLDHNLAFGSQYQALVRALGETHDEVTSSALAGASS
jgi:uncharacterized membrane protein